MLLIRGIFCGTVLISASVPHWARSRPKRPPTPASSTLSVSNCRMMRTRLAPMAGRKAISCPGAEGANSGEQHAFGQQLPDDADAAGAHGRAQGDFFPARRGAGEKKVRDVGVRDEQHTNDGAEKDVERNPHIPHHLFE